MTAIYLDQVPGVNCTGNYSIENRDCSGSDGDSYTSLIAAAAATSDNDTIYVRSGTYIISANVTIANKTVQILGYDEDRSLAIFDFNADNTNITIDGGTAAGSAVKYITFTNGNRTTGNLGLLYIYNGATTDVQYCDFINSVTSGGNSQVPAAVSFRQSDGSVKYCNFTGITVATRNSPILYLYQTGVGGAVVVEENIFSGNMIGEVGEGMATETSAPIIISANGDTTGTLVTLKNNEYYGNTVYSQQGSPSFLVSTCNSQILVDGDYIHDNTAPGSQNEVGANGGTPSGFRVVQYGDGTYSPTMDINNIRVLDNTATDKHPSSIARIEDSTGTINFLNGSFLRNTATAITGVSTGLRLMADDLTDLTVNISKCVFDGNTASTAGDQAAQAVGHLIFDLGTFTIDNTLFKNGSGLGGSEITSGGIGVSGGKRTPQEVVTVSMENVTFVNNTYSGALGNAGNDIAIKDTLDAGVYHVLNITNVAFNDSEITSLGTNDYTTLTNTTSLWEALVANSGKLKKGSPALASENAGTAIPGINGTGTTDLWGYDGLDGFIPIGAYFGPGEGGSNLLILNGAANPTINGAVSSYINGIPPSITINGVDI